MNGRAKVLLLVSMLGQSSLAFSPSYLPNKRHSTATNNNDVYLAASNGSELVNEECGCGDAEFTGRPSSSARNIRHLDVISNLPIYSIDGIETTISETLQAQARNNKTTETSLVVFLRSLG